MSSWLVCDIAEIFSLPGDSSTDFHFLHWENNNVLLPFVSYLLAIYPWKNFPSHPAAILRLVRNPWKPFEYEHADAELHPSCMEKSSWAPFLYKWGEELSHCHQGKRAGEQQVPIHILMTRPESGASQYLRWGPSQLQTCFDITCLLLLLLFQRWTKVLKPLKLFCTHSWHWILPNLECPFISVWAHSLLLLSL